MHSLFKYACFLWTPCEDLYVFMLLSEQELIEFPPPPKLLNNLQIVLKAYAALSASFLANEPKPNTHRYGTVTVVTTVARGVLEYKRRATSLPIYNLTSNVP